MDVGGVQRIDQRVLSAIEIEHIVALDRLMEEWQS